MAGTLNDATLVLDNRALETLFHSPAGPVYRDVERRATRVQARARALVGKKTGKLERSIVKRAVRDSRGFAFYVGADLPYALAHHQGTRPHVIRGNPLLAFYSAKAGRVIVVPQVRHPGTRPNPYLREALVAAR